MSNILYPGTDPEAPASVEQADRNVAVFCNDLQERGYARITTKTRIPGLDADGWYGYRLGTGDGRVIELLMPGLELQLVRFMGDPEQGNIRDYPRLYVDSVTWAWRWALRACRPPEGYTPPKRPVTLTPYEQAAEDDANDSAPERCGDPDCDC